MIEKNPAQIIPSAATGEPLPAPDAAGNPAIPVSPDWQSADALQRLANIDASLIRLVFLLERFLDDDSSEVTSNNGA